MSVASQLNLLSANSVVYNSDLTSDLRVQTGVDQRYGNSRHPRHVKLCAKILLLLIGHRVLRKLNSTGDKWAHLPDIARWLKEDDSKIGMTFLLLAGERVFKLDERIIYRMFRDKLFQSDHFTALALLIWIAHECENKEYRRQSLIFNTAIAACIYLRHMTNNAVLRIPLYFSSR